MAPDSNFGAPLIGTIVAAVLLGVSWAQALYYFTHQTDTWHIKSMVIALITLDTAHQILISFTIYRFITVEWGHTYQLRGLLWSTMAQGFSAFIVQSFLTFRIWRLSYRNKYITGTAAILTIAELVIVLVYGSTAFTLEFFPDILNLKGESISVYAVGAAADLIIAVTLCILLGLSRTGFKKSDAIVRKLIIFTVNTGLISSLCAIAALISILASPGTFIYFSFFFCIGRLYTNSLLATLNARGIIRSSSAQEETGSSMLIPLQTILKSMITSRHPNVSVKIDTTLEGTV